MSNTVNYVTTFEKELVEQYKRESFTADLLTPNIKFINANTVKLPFISVGGYKDHNRNADFNRQGLSNDFIVKTLKHDRDVEFRVDSMDVDETNLALSVANISATFEKEQAIPETDSYVFSKLYADYVSPSIGNKESALDKTELNVNNILETFDTWMLEMTEAEVPLEGRVLYVTPTVNKLLKNALKRELNATEGVVDRAVTSLDKVTIKEVVSSRLKTAFNFENGCKPAASAKQINAILVHPSCVLYAKKHSYIHMFTPGSDSRAADAYLYQNRAYWDAFLIERRVDGIKFNVQA